MARHASTYRQARRAVYRDAVASGMVLTWDQFNAAAKGKTGNYSYGTPRNILPPQPWFADGSVRKMPSKYMPHIGAKQRAKGAARAA